MDAGPSAVPGELTQALWRVRDGDREAAGPLLALVYHEMRTIAAARLQRERDGHTLTPTDLVHEAWIRLAGSEGPRWNDRGHFFRAAAVVMRYILVDHARSRKRQKRGGGAIPVQIQEGLLALEDEPVDLIDLDGALRKLEAIAPRQLSLIELRFFAGLSNKDAAEAMGLSERTAYAEWRLARAWLLRELTTD